MGEPTFISGGESRFMTYCVKGPKYHPRQWVDVSGPTYKTTAGPDDVIILFLANARKREKRWAVGLSL
jgi:hypothetical protein